MLRHRCDQAFERSTDHSVDSLARGGNAEIHTLNPPQGVDGEAVVDVKEEVAELYTYLRFGEISEEVEVRLAYIAADREALGTLAEDPLTFLDVFMAELITLIARFDRGEQITQMQRRALSAMLRLGMKGTIQALSREHARREAARRGGMSGRTVDPEAVMQTWRAKLAEGNGKKTWADAEAAKVHNISASAVRKIRTAQSAGAKTARK